MPPEIRDIDLMALADGELTPEERADLEAQIAAQEPERKKITADKLAAIDEVGEVVRGHLEIAADDAEPRFAGMWGEIEKRMMLDAEAVGAEERRRVKKVPARPARSVTEAPPGFWGKVARWFDAYRGHMLTGALSAGAVAAIALVMRPAKSPSVPAPTSSEVPIATTQPDPDPKVVPVVLQHTPAVLDSVEVPEGSSTVFTFEDEDGEQTTVIWVTPEDTVEGL